MEEGTVRMAAQMYALVAEMEAEKAELESMNWENAQRLHRGESMAYPEGEFMMKADNLRALADRLRKEI